VGAFQSAPEKAKNCAYVVLNNGLFSFEAFSLSQKPDALPGSLFARSYRLAASAATLQAALPRSIRAVMPFAARQA